jgi:hypothetical protein
MSAPDSMGLYAEPNLLDEVTCPHCWHRFPPEEILWRSASENLLGDPVLGSDSPLCFLPSRFDPSGFALDANERLCHVMVCPRCHLSVPRDLLFVEPDFISVVGAPGSGKSYLLAAMTHNLRRLLPQNACLVFSDADAEANLVLADNERTLFHNPDSSTPTYLRKTETAGNELYNSVLLDGQSSLLPRPFLFTVRPSPSHAGFKPVDPGLALVLYDNAGESFIPGADTDQSPVTRHVTRSRAILYVFDPTKDASFRSRLSGDDPQIARMKDIHRQDVMLTEIALRIRRLLNLSPGQRHRQPLLLLVGKYDLWRELLGVDIGPTPLYFNQSDNRGVLSGMQFDSASLAVRELLQSLCPEIVATAESNWECVRYVPVGATGCSPTVMADSGLLAVRPEAIKPIWSEAAVAWLLAKWRPDWLPEWRPQPPAGVLRPIQLRKSGNALVAQLPNGKMLETPLDYAGHVIRLPRLGCDIWLTAPDGGK